MLLEHSMLHLNKKLSTFLAENSIKFQVRIFHSSYYYDYYYYYYFKLNRKCMTGRFEKIGIPQFLDSGRKSLMLDSLLWMLGPGLWTLDARL